MIKPVAQVRLISALKVCGNHRNVGHHNASPAGRMAPPNPPPTPLAPTIQNPFAFALPPLSELSRPSPTFLTFFGNPCLDIFFRVVEPDTALQQEANRNYLNQLLPMAWSHNPLTTLKRVCNLIDRVHRHLKMRQRILLRGDVLAPREPSQNPSLQPCRHCRSSFEAVLGILRTASSPTFKISSSSNQNWLENLSRNGMMLTLMSTAWSELGRGVGVPPWTTCMIAPLCFPKALQRRFSRGFHFRVLRRRGRTCGQSPRAADEGGFGALEGSLGDSSYTSNTNRYGYHYPDWSGEDPSPVQKYLEEVKAGGKSKIRAAALLPHEIVEHVCDNNELRQAAELQWKAMVEDVYLKQGKFKSCLAVCDVSGSMMRVPWMYPWGDDLRSKCTFMKRMDGQEWHCQVDFRKVFDLIMEVAVNANLKPEQMIKKIFVFSIYHDLDEISANDWEIAYEAIQSKFKEKGYVVPDLVVWNLDQEKSTPAVPCTHSGVKMLSGFINNNLVKSFLEDNGDIGPDHVMEAALSAKEYQNLVVLD
ncbi:hypothetical protein FF1_015658 [Malus domestica]